MKKGATRNYMRRLVGVSRVLPIFLGAFLFSSLIFANPEFNNVAAGQASVSQTATTTTVNQTSQQAILNWHSFNIGSGESTHFQQPTGGVTFNRINPSQGVSQIYGNLTATGRIILSNPAGIHFGPNAYVNVGGLIATTMDMSDSDFMSGNYHFSQVAGFNGEIINQGHIVAATHGLIALVGGAVTNDGLIEAHLGQVILASGSAVTMSFAGNDLVNFTVDGASSTAKVTNTGGLIADGGKILVSAKATQGVLDNVINMQGYAQAKSVGVVNGDIVFSGGTSGIVRIAGNVNASGKNAGEKGGNITVVGHNLLLMPTALLDVSGDAGAGNAWIGGNYFGSGPLQNANAVIMTTGAKILADAITTGKGGEVILWADNYTRFFGEITARGGAVSGDGGFVETSGKQDLEVGLSASVNTLAPHGKTGDWLLDPSTLNIVTGGTATLAQVDQFTDNPGTATTIAPATINAAAANVSLRANGDITVTNAIAMTNAGITLLLNAGRDIIVNANISTNNANLTLFANDNAATSANRGGTGIGSISVSGGVTLSTSGANTIALTIGPTNNANFKPGAINIAGNLTTASGGTVLLTLPTPNSGPNSVISGTITTSNLTKASGAGQVTLSGSNSFIGTSVVTLQSGSGTMIASNVGAFNSVGTFSIASGTTLQYSTNSLNNTSSNYTINGTGNGGIGALVFNGTTGSWGNFGTFTMGSDSTISVADVNSTATISGGIVGAFGLTKIGAGTLSLQGNSTYSGTTTVTAGTLSSGASGVGTSTATGTSAISVAAGARFDVLAALNNNNKTITIANTGILRISNSATLINNVAISSGTIVLENNPLTGGNPSYSGTISGAGGGVNVTLYGVSSFSFTTTNSYTGATTITSGLLSINSSNGLGTSAGTGTSSVSVLSGGALGITTGSLNNPNTISIAGNGFAGSANAALYITNIPATLSNPILVSANSTILSTVNTTFNGTINSSGGNFNLLVHNTAGSLTFGAAVGGSLGLNSMSVSAPNSSIAFNSTLRLSANNASGGISTMLAGGNITFNANVTKDGSFSEFILLRSDYNGTGTGTVVFNGGSNISLASGSGLSIQIIYNPTVFGTPTTFYAGGVTPIGYMLIQGLGASNDTTTSSLASLSNNAAGLLGTGKNYALAKDIDASATSTWNFNGSIFNGFNPISGLNNNFFNGLNFAITNLYINRPSTNNVGLFSSGSVAITNINLITPNITGAQFTGGLIGNQSSSNGIDAGGVYGGTITGTSDVGGIIGSSNSIIGISRLINTATVTGTGSNVGGIAGSTISSVTNSVNYGSVSGGSNVGGIVGFANSNNNKQDLSNVGSVTGSGSNVGGIIGLHANAGGLSNALNSGVVTGGSVVGGLVGSQTTSAVTVNSFWDTDSSGRNASQGVGSNTGGTFTASAGCISGTCTNGGTVNLSSQATYSTFTFGGDLWRIHAGDTRAYLAFVNANYPLNTTPGTLSYETTYTYKLKVFDIHELQAIETSATALTANIIIKRDLNASGTYNVADIWGTTKTNGRSGWVPIGDGGQAFSGSFTGGYVVYNLFINRPSAQYVGLFGINSGTISQTAAIGNVFGLQFVGGLVGYNVGFIDNAYSLVNVTGSASSSYVGGFVGYNGGQITNVYSAGLVQVGSGSTNGGAFIGVNAFSVTGSYYDTSTSGALPVVGSGSSSGITGNATAAMKTQSTFVGWDFTNIWQIQAGITYPYFKFSSFQPISSFFIQLTATGAPASGSVHVLKNGVDFKTFTADGSGNVVFTFEDGDVGVNDNLIAFIPSNTTAGNLIFTLPTTSAILSGFSFTANTANVASPSGAVSASIAGIATGRGSVVDTGLLFTASGGNLTFTSAKNFALISANTLTLNGNITTSGGGTISLAGPTTLSSGATLSTTAAGAITISSTLNSSVAGSNALVLSGTNVSITGAIGGTTKPLSVSVTGTGTIGVVNVSTTGAQSYNATTSTTLSGTSYVTSGGTFGVTGAALLGANLTIDTTNAGGTPAGANISFSSTINNAQTLTLTAGTAGGVTVSGIAGGTTPLTSFTASGNTISTAGVRTTGAQSYTGTTSSTFNGTYLSAGGVFGVTGAALLGGATSIDTTNAGGTAAGANITFSSTINNGQTLSLTGGTSGAIILSGIAGGTTPLTSFTANANTISTVGVRTTGAQSYTGATSSTFNGTYTTTVGAGGTFGVTGAALLGGATSITTTNANISFSSTINNGQTLSLTAGSGAVTLTGIIGGTTALTSLTASGATIAANNVRTTGAQSYTGTTSTTFNGTSYLTAGGTFGVTGAALLGAAVAIDTTNTGGTPAGANISFSTTIDNAQTLTLTGGTAGAITISGITGGTTPLTSFTANANTISTAGVRTTGVQSYTGVTSVTFNGTYNISGASNAFTVTGASLLGGATSVTTNNGNISFSSTINNTQTLSLTAGTGSITFSGIIGGATALSSLTASGSTITALNVRTTGTQSYTGSTSTTFNGTSYLTAANTFSVTGAALLGAAVVIDTTNAGASPSGASITFSSTINNAQTLTLTGGSTGAVTVSGIVGGTTPLTSFTASGNTISTVGVRTTGVQSYTGATSSTFNGTYITTVGAGGTFGVTGPALLGGATSVTTTNANISFSSTINNGQTLSLTAGTGAVTVTGATGGTSALTSFTASGNTIAVNNVRTTSTQSYTGATSTTFNGTSYLTAGGTFGVTGPALLGAGATIDTTNSGGTPAGANITFSTTINNAQTLNLVGGTTGAITVSGIAGGTTPLTSFTANANTISTVGVRTTGAQSYTGATSSTFNGTYITTVGAGGTFAVTGPALLGGATSVTTTNGNISFSSTINNGQTLSLTAGTGAVTVTGATGGTSALTSFTASGNTIAVNNVRTTSTQSYTGATSTTFNGTSYLTAGGTFTVTGPALLGAGATIDTTNSGGTPAGANISFSSTINNGQTLSLVGGTTGAITVSGIVGGTTALTSFTASGNTIAVNNVRTTSTQSYTGTTSTTFNGTSYLTAGGTFTVTGPALLGAGATIDTTNSGGTPAGANISFSSTINNGQTLSLVGGTVGAITVSGIAGGTTPLTSFTANANTVSTVGVRTTGAQSYTGATSSTFNGTYTISGAGSAFGVTGAALLGGATSVTTTNGNISFSSTINNGQTLSLAGGTGAVTVTGATGGTTALTSFTASGNTIAVNNVRTTSTQSYTGTTSTTFNGTTYLSAGGTFGVTGAALLGTGVSIDTTNGGGTPTGNNISFSSTINNAQTLTLNSGTTGTTSFSGIIGGSTPLTSITATGATLFNAGATAATTTGAQTYNGAVTINAATTTYTVGTNMTFNNTITGGSAGRNLTLTGGAGANVFTLAGTLSSLGTVTVTGAGGTDTLAVTIAAAKSFNITSSNTGTITGLAGVATAFNWSAISNLTGGGSDTLTNTNTTNAWTLTGSNTGTVTNLSGSFTGMANLTGGSGTDTLTAANVANSWSITGSNTGSVTNLTGTFSAMENLTGGTTTDNFTINGGTISGTMDGSSGTDTITGGNTTNNWTVNGTNAGTLSPGGNFTAIENIVGGNATDNYSITAGSISSIIDTSGNNTISQTGGTIGSFAFTGPTQINTSVTTTGTQTYTGATTLNTDVTLTTTNSAVLFGSTINSLTSGRALTINTGTGGAITFNGAIGNTLALSSLNPTSTSAININAGTIITTGAQTYTGPVILVVDSTLRSTSSGAISFSSTINRYVFGTGNLVVATTDGNITFSGAVGGSVPLTSIRVTAPASTNNVSFGGTVNLNSSVDSAIIAGQNISLANSWSNIAGGSIYFRTDYNGTGTGTFSMTTGNIQTSGAGTINIYYNPTTFGTQQTFYTGGTNPASFMLIHELGAADATTSATLASLSNNSALWVNGNGFALSKDINASSTSSWNGGAGFIPIGTLANPFSAHFDGLGYSIIGLTINRPSTNYVGLFGRTSSLTVTPLHFIRNVNLINVNVTGLNQVGALIGEATTQGGNATSITNIYASGTVTSSNGSDIGGLIGLMTGTVEIKFSTAAINVTANSSSTNVGGLAGNNNVSGFLGSIQNSASFGSVSGGTNVGGFIGINQSATGWIVNSYSLGAVNGGTNVGGFAGQNINDGNINGAYSTGAVTGTTTVGGFVGLNTGTNTSVTARWDTDTSGRSNGYGLNTGWVGSVLTGGCFSGSCTNGGTLNLSLAASYATYSGATIGTNPSTDAFLIYSGQTRPMLAIEYNSDTRFIYFTQRIFTAHSLQLMSINATALAANYNVGYDINASGTHLANDVWGTTTSNNLPGFRPIGDSTTNFTGSITGPYAITDIYIYQPSGTNVGVFGFVGSTGSISKIGVTGSVRGLTNVGGLIGTNAGTVSNAYSTANVFAGNSSTNVGGFVGINSGSISFAYSAGAISVGTSPTNTGGFAGNNSGTFANSYWDTTTSTFGSGTGTGSSTGLTGNITSVMKQQATYSGWDFTNIWKIDPGVTYPYFRLPTASTTFLTVIITTALAQGTGVHLLVNGVDIKTALAELTGDVTFTFTDGELASNSVLLAFLPGNSTLGNLVFTVPTAAGGTVTGLSFTSNTVFVTQPSGADNALATSSVAAARGTSVTDTGLLYTVSGNNITLAAGKSYTLNSSSTYSSDGNITASSGGNITFNSAATLSATSTFAAPGGNITLGAMESAFNNLYDIFISGASVYTQNGNIGSTNRLHAFNVISASSVLLGGNITTNFGTTFSAPVTLTANSILTVASGGSVQFNNTVNGAFALTVNSADQAAFNANVGQTTPLASLTATATNGITVNFGSSIFTTTGAQLYNSALAINDNVTFTTTNSPITFASTFDSLSIARSPSFTTGSGNVTFTGNVGGVHPLGFVGVTSTGTTTVTGTFVAAALTVNNGTLVLNDTLTLSNALQVTGGSSALRLNNNITVNLGGSASASFSGTVDSFNSTPRNLFINGGSQSIFSGAVGSTFALGDITLIASSNVQFGSTVNATGLFTSTPLTYLGGNVTTTGATGQSYSGNVNLTNNVQLISGANAITIGGAISGSGRTLTLQDNTAGATGTINIGAITALDTLVTFARGYSIIFAGSGAGDTTITNAVTFNNTAGLTLYNAVYNFTGGVTYAGLLTTVGATINTSNTPISFSSISNTAGNLVINSNGGNITLGAINNVGTNLYNFNLNSGAGTITLNGGIGTPSNFNNVTIDSTGIGNNLVVNNNMVANSNILINIGGGISGTATYTVPYFRIFSISGGLVSLGNNNAVSTAYIVNNNGNVIFNNTLALALDRLTVFGNVTLTNSGGALTQTALAFTTNVSGTTSLSVGANPITLTAPLFAGVGNVFTGALTLSNSGNNDINILGTSNYTIAASNIGRSLTISTNGTVTQTGAIVSANAGTLTVKTTNDTGSAITLTNASNEFTNVDLRARNLADSANVAAAISYTDVTGFNVNTIGTLSTVNLTANGALTDSGAITGTTLTTSSVGGTVLDFGHALTGFNATNTTSGNITLVNSTNALSVTGIAQPSTGTVSITNNGGNLTFSSALNNGYALVASSSGSVIFSGALGGSTPLASVNATGTSGVQLNGGGITTTGTQSYTGAATLGAATTLTTTNNNIAFSSTLNGAQTLTLAAGNGVVSFGGAIGTTTAPTTFSSTGAGNVSFGGTVGDSTHRLTSVSVTGSATVNSGVFTSGAQTFAAVTLGSGTTFDSSTSNVNISGNITGGGFALTMNVAGSTSAIDGVISNISSLTSGGAGTLTLSNANLYTTTTNINAGTLVISNASALGTVAATVTIGSATLQINGNAFTLPYAMTLNNGATIIDNGSNSTSVLSGNITLSSSASTTETINVVNSNQILTINTLIGGNASTGNLIKSGNGTLLLPNANNSYVGITTINAGSVDIRNNTSLGSGNIALNNASLITAGGSNLVIANNIAFGGTSNTFDIAGGATLTFNGILSGNTTFVKAGNGVLTIGGLSPNTFSGTTTINAGTLNIAKTSALGNGAVTVNTATLGLIGTSLSLSNTLTLNTSSVIVDTNANGRNTLSGGITLSGTNTVTVGSPSGALTLSGAITGSTTLSKTGTGTLVLSNNNSYSGTTTVSAGTLALQNSNALGTSSATINSSTNLLLVGTGLSIGNVLAFQTNSNLIDNNANGNNILSGTAGAITLAGTFNVNVANPTNSNLSITGNITGTGLTINKSGLGNLTLSGAKAYTGNLNVNSGIVTLTNNTSAGTSTGLITVKSGAALIISGTSLVIANPITFQSGGTITDNNAAGGNTLSGTITLATGTNTINVNGSTANVLTLSGVVTSGAATTLNKIGVGVLAMTNTNSYTGTTNINAGTIRLVTNAAALNNTTVNVNTGATLDISNALGANFTNALNLTSATLLVTGTNTLSGSNLALSGSNVINANGSLTISKVVTGTGTLSFTNAGGTVVMSGTNNYSGAINLTAGTLTAGNASGFGTGILNLNGGTLNANSAFTLANSSFTVGGTVIIGGSNNIVLPTGTINSDAQLTISNSATTNFNGSISGSGNLIISAGTTQMSASNASFSGSITLNGGTLQINSTAASVLGTGTLNFNGGILLSNVNNSIANDWNLGGNTAVNGSGNLTWTGNGQLLSGNTLTLSSSGTTAFNGSLNDAGNITIGAGSVTFAGTSTGFSGIITLNGGSATVTTNTGIGTGSVVINPNTTFTANAVTLDNNNFTLNGSAVQSATLSTFGNTMLGGSITIGTSSQNNYIIAQNGTLIINNNIDGAGDLILLGSAISGTYFNVTPTVVPQGSQTGVMIINGEVGRTTPLNSIISNVAVTFGGTDNITTGNQFWDAANPITLVADAKFISLNGNVTINAAINGNFPLTVRAAGVATVNGAIGDLDAVQSFTISAPTIYLNGGVIVSTGSQNYNGNVTFNNTTYNTLAPNSTVTFTNSYATQSIAVKTAGNTNSNINTSNANQVPQVIIQGTNNLTLPSMTTVKMQIAANMIDIAPFKMVLVQLQQENLKKIPIDGELVLASHYPFHTFNFTAMQMMQAPNSIRNMPTTLLASQYIVRQVKTVIKRSVTLPVIINTVSKQYAFKQPTKRLFIPTSMLSKGSMLHLRP